MLWDVLYAPGYESPAYSSMLLRKLLGWDEVDKSESVVMNQLNAPDRLADCHNYWLTGCEVDSEKIWKTKEKNNELLVRK